MQKAEMPVTQVARGLKMICHWTLRERLLPPGTSSAPERCGRSATIARTRRAQSGSMRALRIFVSSTYADLLEYRQAASAAIIGLGHQSDDMELWSADDRSGVAYSVDRVKQSDVLLLVLAHRYGKVPDGE